MIVLWQQRGSTLDSASRQALPQVVPIGADVFFDTTGIMSASIVHVGQSVIFGVGGTYLVQFTVSGVEPNQFALFRNGVAIPGTIFGSGAGTQNTFGQAIVALVPGDVITLRNHSSAAAVTLQTLAGGTQINVNASLTDPVMLPSKFQRFSSASWPVKLVARHPQSRLQSQAMEVNQGIGADRRSAPCAAGLPIAGKPSRLNATSLRRRIRWWCRA